MKKIFLILALLFTVQASATPASWVRDVTGLGMPPELANYLILNPPPYSASLLPGADNSYDLGSTSLTWRTLYTGTSRIAKTSDILRVRQDAQRLFTWDAASDTAFTQKWGDAGVTAVQDFFLESSTADADDDSRLILAGGGTNSSSRGAFVTLNGNEVSGGGDLVLNTGDAAGSDATVNLNLSTGSFIVRDSSTAAVVQVTGSVGDVNISKTGGTLAIQEATAGSACSGTLTCNATSDVVTSTTCAKTGSRIFLTRTSADSDTDGSYYVKSISDATSFTVNCNHASDTATMNWIIFHEAS